MMKIEELRIGNYVMYNGIVVSVYGIIPPSPNADDYWNDVWILELFDGASTITARLEDISPIDFDMEWLKRFSFDFAKFIPPSQHCGVDMFYGYNYGILRLGQKSDIILRIKEDFSKIKLEDFYVSDLKHVHDIQNLVYSLTKKELKL